MAVSSSAHKDVQGHVYDIFDGSFRSKDSVKWKVYAIFAFHVVAGWWGNDGYFPLSREVRVKQKEKNRLPAHVINVGMAMAKNVEWTSCLESYPQRRISSSIAALSFISFKNNETDWKKN